MQITIDNADVKIENGQVTINIDESKLKDLIGTAKVELSTLEVGDEFKLGDEVFIVLEHTDGGTKVISKGFAYSDIRFGSCSDWRKSPLRTEILNRLYFNRICNIVGENNILLMTRDLTSLDGLDDYGSCIDIISLLTASEYAKYHKILGLKSHYHDWWWLITPASTPNNDYARGVCYISSRGLLRWSDCDHCNGIRPFFTLRSSVLVTKVSN